MTTAFTPYLNRPLRSLDEALADREKARLEAEETTSALIWHAFHLDQDRRHNRSRESNWWFEVWQLCVPHHYREAWYAGCPKF